MIRLSNIIFLIFIILSLYLSQPTILNADENEQELAKFYPDQILNMDIDNDDENENISLVSADINGDTGNQAYIIKVVDDGNYVSTKAELINGWNLVYLFTIGIYPTLPPYIAVGYTYQGEIPYSIDLFRYQESPVSFSRIKRIAQFRSDVGSILLKDVDGDDIKEIIVKNSAGDVTYKYIDDDKWEKLTQ